MKSHFLVAAAALVAVLAFAGSAAAASIDDLRALGYTVNEAFTRDNGCVIYSISGFGVSSYLDSCDPATIDAMADPAGHCNRKWQFEHPDQVAALQTLGSKGYSVSGDQCADRYVVTNGFTGKAIYDGAGAGMVAVAATAEAAAPVVGPGLDGPTTPAPTPTTCLPLCPPEIAVVEPVVPVTPPPPPVTVEPATPTAPPAAEAVTAAAPSATVAAVEAATAEVELARFSAAATTLASPAPAAALRWQDAASLVR